VWEKYHGIEYQSQLMFPGGIDALEKWFKPDGEKHFLVRSRNTFRD
jgi:hypothetical protein